MEEKDYFDGITDEDLANMSEEELEEYAKKVEEFTNMLKENALDDAYDRSPKDYNDLLDNMERNERQARFEDGTYTVDDMLDDLEDKRDARIR